MESNRHRLIELIEQNKIEPDKIPEALKVLQIVPSGKSWKRYIDQLLLYFGGLSLCFAAMFFLAYNWGELGRFTKFGLIEVVILGAVIFYCRLPSNTLSAKMSILAASLLLGILLALYGQTYQTGADPWQLFCNWALLILPWVIISRFPVMWVVWVALVNLTIILYHQAIRGEFWAVFYFKDNMLWMLFTFNLLALFTWEILWKHFSWITQSWAPRLITLAASVPLTWMAIVTAVELGEGYFISIPVWIGWLTLLYTYYQKYRRDLFMLSCGCLSGIVVIISFLGRFLLEDLRAAGFFILAIVVITMGTGSAIWLKKVHKGWQA